MKVFCLDLLHGIRNIPDRAVNIRPVPLKRDQRITLHGARIIQMHPADFFPVPLLDQIGIDLQLLPVMLDP